MSVEEITKAVNLMQSGKTPGPNGFPVEFYKALDSLVGPHLLEMFKGAYETRKLPPNLEHATIVVIHKKVKQSNQWDTYRPISLLNTETKILAKILAHRLVKVIPSRIHENQTGFMPGRSARQNLRRLHCWLDRL